MLLENSISKLIRLYEETTFIPQSVIFSTGKNKSPVFGIDRGITLLLSTLRDQRGFDFLLIKNFNIILLPLDSYARTVECWALQDILQFSEGQYQIFATTDTDDILFCDMKDDSSPVYAGSPGDPNFYKLSASLTEFLEFYFAFSNFWKQREDVPLEEFIAGTDDLIKCYLSPSVQTTAKEYLFR